MTSSALIKTEHQLQQAIQEAFQAHDLQQLYSTITALANRYVQQGLTQEAADILAFVLLQAELPINVHDEAEILFEELEARICPRVIWDAKAFAQAVTLPEVIAYILAE